MKNITGSHTLLQVQTSFNTPCGLESTPLEEFVQNRIENFYEILTEDNALDVLRDVYLAGLFDSSLTLKEVAGC